MNETNPRNPAVMDWPEITKRVLRRPLYVGLSILIALIAVAGFAPGVIGKFLANKVPHDAIIHVHVAVYSIWLFLFFLQCVFAAVGKMKLHRKLGKVLMGYGALMSIVGISVTLNRFVKQVREGNPKVAQITNFAPFVDMMAFPVFFGLATYYRRKPEVHKRLMIVTATALVYPAMIRISFPGFMRHSWVFMLIWTSPVLIGMAHDWIKRRMIHPAYFFSMFGLALLGLRPYVVNGSAWTKVSGWLASLA